jgi:hypothetical protein
MSLIATIEPGGGLIVVFILVAIASIFKGAKSTK